MSHLLLCLVPQLVSVKRGDAPSQSRPVESQWKACGYRPKARQGLELAFTMDIGPSDCGAATGTRGPYGGFTDCRMLLCMCIVPCSTSIAAFQSQLLKLKLRLCHRGQYIEDDRLLPELICYTRGISNMLSRLRAFPQFESSEL